MDECRAHANMDQKMYLQVNWNAWKCIGAANVINNSKSHKSKSNNNNNNKKRQRKKMTRKKEVNAIEEKEKLAHAKHIAEEIISMYIYGFNLKSIYTLPKTVFKYLSVGIYNIFSFSCFSHFAKACMDVSVFVCVGIFITVGFKFLCVNLRLTAHLSSPNKVAHFCVEAALILTVCAHICVLVVGVCVIYLLFIVVQNVCIQCARERNWDKLDYILRLNVNEYSTEKKTRK